MQIFVLWERTRKIHFILIVITVHDSIGVGAYEKVGDSICGLLSISYQSYGNLIDPIKMKRDFFQAALVSVQLHICLFGFYGISTFVG